MGGTKLKANLRAGDDHNSRPAARAFCCIAINPIKMATAPSTSQVASHAFSEVCHWATTAAATAVIPMVMPPHPGTAVNAPARSMVSRM